MKPPLPLKGKSAEEIVDHWYKEISKYNFDEPGHQPKAVNFTQLVWGRTSSVGMAISQDGRFCVANFYPPGNEPEYNFPRCVRRVREGPPPWVARPPGDSGRPALCEANWDAHAELEENMRKAAERRPELQDDELVFD